MEARMSGIKYCALPHTPQHGRFGGNARQGLLLLY